MKEIIDIYGDALIALVGVSVAFVFIAMAINSVSSIVESVFTAMLG